MIPVSDLRKGNLIKTEHGICPVHHIVFSDVYVLGKDNRVNFAREVEGVETTEVFLSENGFIYDDINGDDGFWKIPELDILKGEDGFYNYPMMAELNFIHEIQNTYYWLKREELKINL